MPVSDELWKEYHLRLHSFVQGRIGDPSVTEDTVQEVFIRIHPRIYQITRNAFTDHYRYQPREGTCDDRLG